MGCGAGNHRRGSGGGGEPGKKKQEGCRNRGEACWSASASAAKAGWLAVI
jgi:hypothetical protein